ncbi:hypothetical protein IBX73_07405 [candidate division WOR-3 bacterium]|nr:hypothetical protein [candidate division WOR-3 bacterium]
MEDKMSVLKGLQAQRDDLTSKLDRIEEKKSSVSAEVYEKVKNEYTEKLRGVDEKLSGHVDLLSDEIQRLRAQEQKIIKSKKETKFKIEEVELRYSIGDYDKASCDKVKREGDARMKQLDGELQKILRDIEYYSGFMKGEMPSAAAPPSQPPEEESELMIDEHLLEEKLPEEEVALDELLSDDDALKHEPAMGSHEEPGPEEDKGVACSKCGHVNSADSWYCEKCGAEILGASGSL